MTESEHRANHCSTTSEVQTHTLLLCTTRCHTKNPCLNWHHDTALFLPASQPQPVREPGKLPTKETNCFSDSRTPMQMNTNDHKQEKTVLKLKGWVTEYTEPWRANAQMIHIGSVLTRLLCSCMYYTITIPKVLPTSCHLPVEWLHKFKLSPETVTLNEGQGHSNKCQDHPHWYQTIQFSSVHHHT